MMFFNIAFILTFVLTRIVTYKLHDINNYNSNTVTGVIRRKIKFDFHHIYGGYILDNI